MSDPVWYREWCSQPFTRNGLMLKQHTINKIPHIQYDAGYSSVFCFSKEDAAEVQRSRSSVGLQRFSVGSDRVVIDLDNGDEERVKVEKILQSRGWGYSVYFSGSKGYHIYIPTEFMYHEHLPYSHLQFVLGLGIQCDESLYQHGRLLSLVGRVHPKTRKKKKLLKEVPGDMPTIKIVDKPMFVYNESSQVVDSLVEALSRVGDIVISEPVSGTRHVILWGISKDLVRCGLQNVSIEDILNNAVTKWTNPKTPIEVRDIVRRARQQA